MNYLFRITIILFLSLIGINQLLALEEAKYKTINQDDDFEIRNYSPYILAETVVKGDMEDAGNKAFKYLFGYLSGDNLSSKKLAMTAPVSQKQVEENEEIAMTAPVGQKRAKEGWIISFMMPDSYTMKTIPQPKNSKVTLREVPAQKVAAIRYSGFWSEENYLENKAKLESWIQKKGWEIKGEAIWARYNSPYSLWFLRRNEVLIPVKG